MCDGNNDGIEMLGRYCRVGAKEDMVEVLEIGLGVGNTDGIIEGFILCLYIADIDSGVGWYDGWRVKTMEGAERGPERVGYKDG